MTWAWRWDLGRVEQPILQPDPGVKADRPFRDARDLESAAVPSPWWQSTVIYQVYPRSFNDGNGDGIGDLPGLIEQTDYIERLGVGAVWLSPIFRSPMADFGYDVSDYRDVDPVFGTLGDLDRLVAGLHERGIRVLLDFPFYPQ